MRLVAATVWTLRRKLLGNLIPALFWLPPAAAGVYLIAVKGQLIGTGLWLLIASTVVGWLAVNQFGFFENGRMRRQLERILKAEERELSGEPVFVGFATPAYSSMLDAHEDVGFLRVLSDRVVFISESRTVSIDKADVVDVRFRANVHSILGLGRWVSIEAKTGAKSIRLLVEPRERRTLLGNRIYGRKLLALLRKWKGLKQ